MVRTIDPDEFLSRYKMESLVDVRSPREYNQGHIPGAISIPLFSDEERHDVGIIYKRKNREGAIIRGLEYVGPKLADLAQQGKEVARRGKIILYCWRGGMRSESMGWLFSQAGLEVSILKGGYKAFRRTMLNRISETNNLYILGGMTGSGKTEVLAEMEKTGHQVVDLEGLANHKGSAFGSIGMGDQPSTEQFENKLFYKWSDFNHSKVVWLENESKSIGTVFIPDQLYLKMKEAFTVNIEIPKSERVKRLVEVYGSASGNDLKDAIGRIEKRLGGKNCKDALIALAENDLPRVAEIVLSYYDKTYIYGLSKRENTRILKLSFQKVDVPAVAREVIKHATKTHKTDSPVG